MSTGWHRGAAHATGECVRPGGHDGEAGQGSPLAFGGRSQNKMTSKRWRSLEHPWPRLRLRAIGAPLARSGRITTCVLRLNAGPRGAAEQGAACGQLRTATSDRFRMLQLSPRVPHERRRCSGAADLSRAQNESELCACVAVVNVAREQPSVTHVLAGQHALGAVDRLTDLRRRAGMRLGR